MNRLIKALRTFIDDESGDSAVEYAVLVAVVATVVFVAVKQFDLNGVFTSAADKAKACVNGGTGTSC